jgi:uncharacterized membrane protein YedE/YeeE
MSLTPRFSEVDGRIYRHNRFSGLLVHRQTKSGSCPPTPSPIDRQLVIGPAIFGLGWGLRGFCPGPALANLGALQIEALVFVPAMTIGMFLAQRFFGADR